MSEKIQSQLKQNITKFGVLNIIGVILLVIFLPLVILNLIFIIQGWIHPDKVPMIFDTAPLIVVSDSMTIEKDESGNIISGAFNKNDLIFIKKVDPTTLKEGDIITYVAKDGSIVTHRIFLKGTTEDKNASAFVMKGDYNTSIYQDPISYNQVVGLYKGRIAGIGGVANFLQSPIGVIVVLGLPLACILIIDLIKKKKENQLANSKNAELETELAQLKAEKAQKGWKDSSR